MSDQPNNNENKPLKVLTSVGSAIAVIGGILIYIGGIDAGLKFFKDTFFSKKDQISNEGKKEEKPQGDNNCNVNLEGLNNQNSVLNIGNINQECNLLAPTQTSIYDWFIKFDQICTKKEKCISELIEKDIELQEIQKTSLKGVIQTAFNARLPTTENKDYFVCSSIFCVNPNLKITDFNDLSDSEKAKLIVQARFIEDVKNNTLPSNVVTTIVERLEKEKENNQAFATSVANANPYKNQDVDKIINLIGSEWADLGVKFTKVAKNSVQGEVIIFLNSSGVELNRVVYKNGVNPSIYINGKVVEVTVSGNNVSITKAPQIFNPSNANDPVVIPLPDGKKAGEGTINQVFDANGNLVQ